MRPPSSCGVILRAAGTLALLVAGVFLTACGPSPGSGGDGDAPDLPDVPDPSAASGSLEARLRIDGDPAAQDTVILVLENHAATPLGYNLCTSWLERRVEAGWETVPPDRVCTMELRMLPGGEVAHYTLEPASELEPGEYRYVTRVEWQGAGAMEPVASEPFRVDGR